MGQYWRLVNLDRRVAIRLGKLVEGIPTVNLHKYLLPGVLNPLRSFDEIRKFHKLGPCHEQKQSRLLTVLPEDILRYIFECFGSLDDTDAGIDAACFALTCQLCFEAGWSVLNSHQEASHSWAGDRLIIAGDYQDSTDLPHGLTVDPSWKEPGRNIYYESSSFFDRHYALNMYVFKYLMDAARDSGDGTYSTDEPTSMWITMFAMRNRPKTHNRTLRNLTKKEYVREDVLKEAQKAGDYGPYFEKLRDVGDLAAFRICWSSDASVGMDAPKISRGPWAGDRFDIVDRELVDLQEWKDVSEEVVGEVGKIIRDNT